MTYCTSLMQLSSAKTAKKLNRAYSISPNISGPFLAIYYALKFEDIYPITFYKYVMVQHTTNHNPN